MNRRTKIVLDVVKEELLSAQSKLLEKQEEEGGASQRRRRSAASGDHTRGSDVTAEASVSFKAISNGITRKLASTSFLEILQLQTFGLLNAQQDGVYADIEIRATVSDAIDLYLSW